jgi:hypothetical protein
MAVDESTMPDRRYYRPGPVVHTVVQYSSGVGGSDDDDEIVCQIITGICLLLSHNTFRKHTRTVTTDIR